MMRRPKSKRPTTYHHGDLRRALLDAAVADISANGVAALSLRELARKVGVSHAAPVHHFGDKAGVLTAVAAEGFELLSSDLSEGWEKTRSFLEVGVAYVRFAINNRAHFEVMYRPDLYHADDPRVVAARTASGEILYGKVGRAARGRRIDRQRAGVAAWALMHGLSTLILGNNLPEAMARDPEKTAREIGAYLFR